VSVVLVDDEENILRALERLLLDEEYTVLTANSGEAGLQLLTGTEQVAVIVSDQRMPGMMGAEFLARAREIVPDAVRMVLTGYADVTAAMDAINKGGAARYLAKPWDDVTLIQAIRDGVDYYLVLQENRRLAAVVQQQNAELAEWNTNLKGRVMEQTTVIRKQNEELSARNARINDAFSGIIQAFSRLVEMASPRLHSHARNVTALATGIAKDLQLPEPEQETIRIAALLHDIGVIGMPETILAKRTQDMNAEELRIYQQHAIRGQAAVDSVSELRGVGLLIRHHHEQYNGNGYPDRLAKEEIPLGARIIGFADYIDREMGASRGYEALDAVFVRATLQLGMTLDPHFVSSAKRCAKYVYFVGDTRNAGVENEYSPSELVTGMQITRDIYCGTGMLLITKGTTLDRQMIESIQRYYEIDPPSRGVFAIIVRKSS
jgi:response regulator RpfG family c-di-GMP phosphodiesterase